MSYEIHWQTKTSTGWLCFDVTVDDVSCSKGRPACYHPEYGHPEYGHPEEYPEIEYSIVKIVQHFDESEVEIDDFPSMVNTGELDDLVMEAYQKDKENDYWSRGDV